MSHPSTSNPAVVQVAIASPLYRLFDYLPVAGGSIQCHPLGSRVLVPFGKREVVGIVAGHQSQSALAIAQLKCVIKPLGSRAALEPPQLKLAHWLADYYHHSRGAKVNLLYPCSTIGIVEEKLVIAIKDRNPKRC